MKNTDDFFRVVGSRHPFVKEFLPDDIATRGAVTGELRQLEVRRDILDRITQIQGYDHDGRQHRLEFHWVETDRVKAGEALLLRGGTVEGRMAVSWNRGICSSRVSLPNQHIHLALNGEAGEGHAKIQLSFEGEVFEGEVHDKDKELPLLRDFARTANARQAAEHISRYHVELLLPLLPELDRFAINARATPGGIGVGEGVLCGVGTAACAYVGGLAAVPYAFACFGMAALG
jgi:hypothetical protein